MTSTAQAVPSPPLSDFEGKPVRRSTISITNAGDGLSEAMKVEPVEHHQGDRVYVVLECEVAKVGFAPIDKDDPAGDQARVHTFRAGTATIVDADLVATVIAEQREKNLKAKEDAAGIVRLVEDGEQLCPFPGCPLPAEHEGDHEHDPASGVAAPSTVEDPGARERLEALKKSQLVGLAAWVGMTNIPVKATGADLVDRLVVVPGICGDLDAMLAAQPEASNVSPINGAASDD